jgi:hypothetical protein
VPLRLWFRAMYHLTQSKQGISSVALSRRLGVTQTTAWKIKHKLAQVMMERDAIKPLSGRVELDDAYLGGERTGGKRGSGAPGKTPFVAAVETTPEGKPVQLKLRRVASFCNHSISIFAKRSLDPSCEVVSDGLACFGAVTKAGCAHEVIITGSGAAAARTPGFKWVNTALGNIKAVIVGTYRAIDQKHVPRYLVEFATCRQVFSSHRPKANLRDNPAHGLEHDECRTLKLHRTRAGGAVQSGRGPGKQRVTHRVWHRLIELPGIVAKHAGYRRRQIIRAAGSEH